MLFYKFLDTFVFVNFYEILKETVNAVYKYDEQKYYKAIT